MLPGRTMASAIEDVLFGFPLTGAGRLLAVLVALTGLIIGIATGLSVMLSLTTLLGSDFVSPSVLELRPDQASVLGRCRRCARRRAQRRGHRAEPALGSSCRRGCSRWRRP